MAKGKSQRQRAARAQRRKKKRIENEQPSEPVEVALEPPEESEALPVQMEEKTPRERFLERLGQGPAILFLGQKYLQYETGKDPLLSQIARKYSLQSDPPSYKALVAGQDLKPDEVLPWLDERSRHISAPLWLRLVAKYPWNGVYSSAIDTVWAKVFVSPWRQVQPVYTDEYRPNDPRNRAFLHCTYLFGSVAQEDKQKRAPMNQLEFIRREVTAVKLCGRIETNLTPTGTLVIEGLHEYDWWEPKALFAVASELEAEQVHLFSATDALLAEPLLEILVEQSRLVMHREPLSEVLSFGAKVGLIELGKQPEEEKSPHPLTMRSKTVSIPRETWVQTSRSAVILDDQATKTPRRLSETACYHEYRRFLGQTTGRPDWTGYARGFAFRRDCEEELYQKVQAELSRTRPHELPFIFHGQTGSGKTVALANLAFRVRSEGIYPVLFIENRIDKPAYSDLNKFCQWAEEHGAAATLILWDGMSQDEEEYYQLAGYLAGEGSRAVVVGTSYTQWDRSGSNSEWGVRRRERDVLAPPTIKGAEKKRFFEYLHSVEPRLHVHEGVLAYENFLATLYRLIPSARHKLRAGVTREIGYAEDAMLKASAAQPAQRAATTTFAAALLSSGLLNEELLSEAVEDFGGEWIHEAKKLIGLVMVPGQFGLQVPIELLLRALGKSDYANFLSVLRTQDIFRWNEAGDGNVNIGPRSPLEAGMFAQSLGGAGTEVEYVLALLIETEAREVDFSIKLIQALSPPSKEKQSRESRSSGRDPKRYEPFFGRIAEVLKKLRETRSREEPRLILQEAKLLRKWIRREDTEDAASLNQKLKRIEEIVDKALDILDERSDHRDSSLRSQLLVELASAWATGSKELLEMEPERAKELFRQASRTLREGRAKDPSSYHPTDVLAWASRNILEAKVLDPTEEGEVLTGLISAFESVVPTSFDPYQQQLFNERRLEVGEIFNRLDVADNAFDELIKRGSKAGYYLRAFKLSGLSEVGQQMPENLDRFREALDYLESHYDAIKEDARCLNLYIDLWWMTRTGRRWMDGERVVIPLDRRGWEEIIEHIRDLEATREAYTPLYVLFHRALALFHLGETTEALELFEGIRRDFNVIGRLRRRCYLASKGGKPIEYTGNVVQTGTDYSLGRVFVEGARCRVAFAPREFHTELFNKDDAIPSFHIAFSLAGPIAEPVKPVSRERRR